MPATVRLSAALASCWIVMAPLVAVKPGIVAGVDGSVRLTPESGTGLGMGTLKASGPSGVVAGVAPLASIWAVAEPAKGWPGETAAAADASEAGRFTTVW